MQHFVSTPKLNAIVTITKNTSGNTIMQDTELIEEC